MNDVRMTCSTPGDIFFEFQDPIEASNKFNSPVCSNNPNPTPVQSNILQNCTNCSVISTQALGNAKTNAVANMAASRMDMSITNGYRDAVDIFHQLHTAINTSPTSQDYQVYELSRRKMHEAYCHAVSAGQVPSGSASCSYLNGIIAVLDTITNSVPDTSGANYAVKFYAYLEKAETYRVAKLHTQALTEFTNAYNIAKSNDRDYVKRWICLTQTEQRVFSGQINPADFQPALDSCSPPPVYLTSSSARMSTPRNSDNEEEVEKLSDSYLTSFNVFPNPASNELSVGYTIDQNSKAVFEILDVNGRIVGSNTLPTDVHLLKIKLDLTPGVYMYRIITDNIISKTDKLIIVKE